MRKELGIAFEGFTYDDRTLNIEVAYDFRKHGYAHRNYISDPNEWSNLFHWKGPPDRWRVHFPTDPRADENALMRPEVLQAQMQRFLPIGKPFDIVGSNLYVVHQRVADKFRAGRAILAGNSAHVNSPIGAMGMNSGIHDAINLADKLIAISRGEADDSSARSLRAPAPPRRGRAHASADHPQQKTAHASRIRGAPAQSRRVAAHIGRSGVGAQVLAAHGFV